MTTTTTTRTSALWALVGAVAVAVVLPHIPFASLLARPFVWLSTLAHEGGHGVGAVLVGGTFKTLQIFPDASGVATSSYSDEPWRRGTVALAGLIGPAVLAGACLFAGVSARLGRAALAFMGACFLALLTVTQGFGTLVAGGWGVLLVAVAWKASAPVARLALLVVAVQLALAVFSRADYLFVGEAETGAGRMPSDVAHVAASFGGHYLLWGVLIGAFSVALLAAGVFALLAADRLLARVDTWRAARAARRAQRAA